MTPVSMSIISIRNRIGPRTEPCGTPEVTGTGVERAVSTRTHWTRFLRNASVQVMIFPPKPSDAIFFRRTLWSTWKCVGRNGASGWNWGEVDGNRLIGGRDGDCASRQMCDEVLQACSSLVGTGCVKEREAG